MGDRHIGEGS
jgi:hypothetical protein